MCLQPAISDGERPGYKLGSLEETHTGLTAKLSLAGAACNAFGRDINDLTIEVTYEDATR